MTTKATVTKVDLTSNISVDGVIPEGFESGYFVTLDSLERLKLNRFSSWLLATAKENQEYIPFSVGSEEIKAIDIDTFINIYIANLLNTIDPLQDIEESLLFYIFGRFDEILKPYFFDGKKRSRWERFEKFESDKTAQLQKDMIAKERSPRNKNFGYVYFIKNNTNNSIKIGFSQDVGKRLKALQTSSCIKLELIGVLKTNDVRAKERELHNLFKKHRLNGEWFSEDPLMLAYIKELVK